MKDYINDVIEKKHLTLSVSAIVKLVTNFDKMMVRCYYKGTPDYIQPENCKFCKEYQMKLKTPDVLCRKHYAIKLYNLSTTNISDIFYREERFKLFGRYVLRETGNCSFLFYMTPMQISDINLTVFAIPNGLFKDKQSKYTWTEFKRPGCMQFEIDSDLYRLDFTNKYHPTIIHL